MCWGVKCVGRRKWPGYESDLTGEDRRRDLSEMNKESQNTLRMLPMAAWTRGGETPPGERNLTISYLVSKVRMLRWYSGIACACVCVFSVMSPPSAASFGPEA